MVLSHPALAALAALKTSRAMEKMISTVRKFNPSYIGFDSLNWQLSGASME